MRAVVDVDRMRPPDHVMSMQIAANETDRLAGLLRELGPDEWHAPTDCDLWSVHDVVGHLVGWGRCLTSAREAAHQVRAGLRRKNEFPSFTDAQNQVQVEDRRALAPGDLLGEYERVAARFLRLRAALGRPGRFVPLYVPFLGGWVTLSFVLDTIFTRDTFMHRIDIARATDRPLALGLHQEVLVADIVRDWATRTPIPVAVELAGPAGGSFAHAGARVTVRASAIDFCRLMAGRASSSDLDIEGDAVDVARCLEVKAPF